MHFSKKLKLFSQSFAVFLKFMSNVVHFERKDDPHSVCISEITDYEIRGKINV